MSRSAKSPFLSCGEPMNPMHPTTTIDRLPDAVPWYREPWPWLLMAGPAAVLVAGAITTWIAFATSDGLVAQDYYKQGLAVNRVLEKEARAAGLGLAAAVEFAPDRHRVMVLLEGAEPKDLAIRFAHSTRSGNDVALRLAHVGHGRYEAAVPHDLPAGRWNIYLEAPRGDWRLAGEWNGRTASFALGGKP
jgi:uncharacterized protein